MFASSFFSKCLLTATAAVAVAATGAPSTAQAGEVSNRIHNQQARINQGVRSGQLTRGEYHRDESRLNADRFARNRDLSRNGGYLTAHQHANLNARLNHNSSGIYNTKHNTWDRPGY